HAHERSVDGPCGARPRPRCMWLGSGAHPRRVVGGDRTRHRRSSRRRARRDRRARRAGIFPCGFFVAAAERRSEGLTRRRVLELAERPLATRLPRQRGLYYGGAWHASAGGRETAVNSPSTGESLGTALDASAEDVDRAIAAARRAFPLWRDTPAQERAKAI